MHTYSYCSHTVCNNDALSVFFLFLIRCHSRVAGEIFAVSLAQGGPAPTFLQEWCNNFLLTGNLENITREDVNDLEFSSLIKMVCCTNCDNLNTIYLNIFKVTVHINVTERNNYIYINDLSSSNTKKPIL